MVTSISCDDNIPVLAETCAFFINAEPCCKSNISPFNLSAITSTKTISLDTLCVKILNAQAIPTCPIPTIVTLLPELVTGSATLYNMESLTDIFWKKERKKRESVSELHRSLNNFDLSMISSSFAFDSFVIICESVSMMRRRNIKSEKTRIFFYSSIKKRMEKWWMVV